MKTACIQIRSQRTPSEADIEEKIQQFFNKNPGADPVAMTSVYCEDGAMKVISIIIIYACN